jgi:hypothetical protein
VAYSWHAYSACTCNTAARLKAAATKSRKPLATALAADLALERVEQILGKRRNRFLMSVGTHGGSRHASVFASSILPPA